MKKTLALLSTACILAGLAACSSGDTSGSGSTPPATPASPEPGTASGAGTPIRILAGGRTFTAVLNDSDAARDLATSLPVTLPAARIGGIEYMVELPAPLTETGPFSSTVEAGDIVYWNPRNSVTVIYAPTSPVSELTKLGEVTSDLADFKHLPENVEMRIERG